MDAHGSLGESLTFAKRRGTAIAEKKPRLPYFLTLPVQYQRWLYHDYAYLWRQQSTNQQRQYAAAGVRYHLTGFQYWMKYQLTNLPDIAGWWKSDLHAGATTPDSSRNNNPATIYGASPTTGFIDGALYFDGINDLARCAQTSHLFFTDSDPWTFECLMNWQGFGAKTLVFYAGHESTTENFILRYGSNNRLGFRARDAVYYNSAANSSNCLLNTPSMVHFRADGSGALDTFINGSLVTHLAGVPTQLHFTAWGRGYNSNLYNFEGILDNVILYNRLLDTTEMITHSLRRWPL